MRQVIQFIAFVVTAVLIATTLAMDQHPNNTTENQARYDHYRLYRLNLDTPEQVKIFQELEEQSDSCIFIGHAREVGQKLSILVAAHKVADVTDLVTRFNVDHTILVENFQAKIDAQWKTVKGKSTPGSEFGWEHYYHLETIYEWIDKQIKDYPDILEPLDLGQSYNGVPVKGVRLSRKAGNTGIFLEAGIHAREWISPATATFLLNQLLTSTDPNVIDLSTNFDWYIFPIVNPDGYKYTFESDRMWRKTRQPNGLCRGADLNRNFDCYWNTTGSSSDPCRYDFAGASAESEPEAKLITKFIRDNKEKYQIRTYLALHSYSQLMMFPHGHTAEKPSNYDDLSQIGHKAIAALAQRYGTEFKTGSIHEIIYPSSGGSMDWAYSEANIKISFTVELRGPPDSVDMFILPADQITPVGLEMTDAFVALLQEARTLGYYNKNEK